MLKQKRDQIYNFFLKLYRQINKEKAITFIPTDSSTQTIDHWVVCAYIYLHTYIYISIYSVYIVGYENSVFSYSDTILLILF